MKLAIVFVSLLITSYFVMKVIEVRENVIGLTMANIWCKEVGFQVNETHCLSMLNSQHYVVVQSLSLAIFLFVIAMTVMHTEWRVAAAILGVVFLILTGVTNPKTLLESVSWDLILFLVGSMTFAGILRELGVFRYLAIQILRLSRYNIYILIFLISFLSFVLSAVVGEVTSIIYIVMLILELKKVLKIDVEPLIIFSVLSTNTGSTALPVGNPIGVYILFQSNLSVSTFIRYAFPLATLNLLVLYLLYLYTDRGYLSKIREALTNRKHNIEAFITSFYTRVYNAKAKKVALGVAFLMMFTITVSLNDVIVYVLSRLLGVEVDPHSFLSFIPYIYIVLASSIAVPLEEVAILVQRAVEWSSIVFFIMLFMLGHTLLYTGAILKIAYALSMISTSATILLTLTLISSATLSAVLDNLSVVVAFTPIAILFTKSGLVTNSIFFALLFGGVFGGNFTPIGSTANIVALSMAEKERIKLTWRLWLSIALITTIVQILVSNLWTVLNTIYG